MMPQPLHCFARACTGALAVATFLSCAGCGDKPADPSSSNPTASPTVSTPLPAGSAPIAGVVPQSEEEKPASGVPGPAAGETAIGGVAGKQDSGGHKESAGTGSAPTGGDGAGSAPK